MNRKYHKLYNKFMKHCQETTPIDRLRSRNPCDLRLINENKHLYVEVHHILPRAYGGTDSKENLVVLLPEEHVMAHKIRYKAYGTRSDMLAVRFIVNGLASKGHIEDVTKFALTKKILNTYAWIKQNSSEFRIKHGWHTESGRKRISRARKGKMYAKDAHTGEPVGVVRIDHPNVTSGMWVHHTKGKKYSEEFLKQRRKERPSDGENNANFKHFATDDFLLGVAYDNLDTVVVEQHFSKKRYDSVLKRVVKKTCNKKISWVILTNRFGSIDNFVKQLNETYGLEIKYNPYFRSTYQRKLAGENNRKRTSPTVKK